VLVPHSANGMKNNRPPSSAGGEDSDQDFRKRGVGRRLTARGLGDGLADESVQRRVADQSGADEWVADQRFGRWTLHAWAWKVTFDTITFTPGGFVISLMAAGGKHRAA
jgi:hypothetical protein